MKDSIRSLYAILIALVALLVAVIALVNSKEAKQLALSEVSLEEGDAITQPIYDQAENRFYYLALYEVHITNLSGPTVILKEISPPADDAGLVVALKGDQVAAVDLKPLPFRIDYTLREIRENPRLLKDLTANQLEPGKLLNIAIKPGATKTVRFGVNLYPYDAQGQSLADMVLLSFRLVFDNGKAQLFRRGFPIMPVAPTP